jgi:hypothetical protein
MIITLLIVILGTSVLGIILGCIIGECIFQLYNYIRRNQTPRNHRHD